ncbi:MAG: helix-turn-helix transcriptional regulator [Chloroflexi bacterium]|nr:helix-turn-helix transcriptional regulator [Desulfobacteraceae bacterium]MCP4142919.1 helix-turn-helix transcriptional regulator [Chloroflexota bacterium]
MELSEKIKHLRKERGVTQKELAERAGLNSKLISKYETGRLNPKLENITKIAEALDISTDYFFESGGVPDSERISDLKLYRKFRMIECMDEKSRRLAEDIIDTLIEKKQMRDRLNRLKT